MNRIIEEYANKYKITIVDTQTSHIAFCDCKTAGERRRNFYDFWAALNHYKTATCFLYHDKIALRFDK